MINTFFV